MEFAEIMVPISVVDAAARVPAPAAKIETLVPVLDATWVLDSAAHDERLGHTKVSDTVG